MRDLRRMIVRENRIYIMPTTGGFLFLASVVVLILTASTYNNNLIFILAFFMFSVFVVSMLQTHYNLKGVRARFAGAEEVFEGDRLGMNFQIVQKRPRNKKGIYIRTRSKRLVTLKSFVENLEASDSTKPVRIEVSAWARGVHKLPEISLETQYPLGLFRAWKVFRPVGEVVIYPRPKLDHPLEASAHDQGEADEGLRSSPDGDFGELKYHLPGESYHQIAWKHYARTGQLYTKVHWGAEDRHYKIPWNPASPKQLEEQLMRMSGWIKNALDENASFEMESPEVPPGRGHEHARACWRLLASIPRDAS